MKSQTTLLLVMFMFSIANSAEYVPLPLAEKKSLSDDSQLVKLAQQEKFIIPLSGRTISHIIQYVPKNSGQCQFIQPTITYRSLAQSQAVFNNEDQITSILPLKTREIVIVADPYFNIASFSIDRHFLLKPKLPKTKISKGRQKENSMRSPILVSTSNEEYIYYLTPSTSYVFHYSNVASDIKQFKLEGSPLNIHKAIQRNGFIILCAGLQGILVYQIDQTTKNLKLVQQLLPKSSTDTPIDMQLNQQTQLLYVLNLQKSIVVYSFDSRKAQLKSQQKVTTILTQYDTIQLQKITIKHPSNANPYQLIGHINIEISRNRIDQSIMVLFTHGTRTIVAQLNYKSITKQFNFVRYFKYSVEIKQIHVIQDVMVVVGSGILGLFPYGIDPHLINEQFNGFMTLTPIDKIVITEAPFFVGTSKNQLEYGGIFLNNEAGINCHISSSSTLKQVKFKANLTVCQDIMGAQIGKYCEYQKTFIIKQMELTASAPVATSLWAATIIFTLLVVVGLCCLFAIQKRKQRQIRKLQLYFQEKRRTLPASSDRAGV